MSLGELAGLARRQALAVAIVLLVALGVAFAFKRTPPTYRDSGSLVLTPVQALQNPNPYTSPWGGSMISTGEVMANWLTSSQGQRRLDVSGVGSNFTAELINFSDQEYPFYGQPYLTVSGVGHTLAAAQSNLSKGVQVFNDELTSLQSQAAVPPGSRITTHLVGDSGPQFQPGSNKRVYAGLGVLALIAAVMLARFLDRRQLRLSLGFWHLRNRRWQPNLRPRGLDGLLARPGDHAPRGRRR